MRRAEWIIWLGLGTVAYSYLAYPFILLLAASTAQFLRDLRYLFRRDNRRSAPRAEYLPRVALIIAAYNEESVIEEKLQNAASLDYPLDRLEILLGLDAPTDATADRAAAIPLPNLRVVRFGSRRGKLAVINDLVEQTSAEILLFSDANTLLETDCVRRLARHFADPQIGVVCGELSMVDSARATQLESVYWRYEVALKYLENRLRCVLGANGAVYAVRRPLFQPLRDSIIEDFELPMNIRCGGYHVAYDPEARAIEAAAPSFSAEFRRRVRIGAGAYQILFRNLRYLNPRHGWLAFSYLSHKVLRWLAPLCLLAALVANLFLLDRPLYIALLAAQTLFYVLAVLGYVRARRGGNAGVSNLPFYFTAMNVALLAGLLSFLLGRQQAVWQATPRELPATAVPAKGQGHE